jgi:VIT1/CCC1 family predicted Fe2+/Mn2+ transporter
MPGKLMSRRGRLAGVRGRRGRLHTFWSSEIVAAHLYAFLAARYGDDDRKTAIAGIGRMERGHAAEWAAIAEDVHGVSFRVSLFLKCRIALLKLLALVLPLTLFMHYLEHGERKAILDYAALLDAYKDDEKTTRTVTGIIVQEIAHEWHMMEQIADKRSYIAKAREAIPGMTAGIIETLGLVIGLLAAHAKTLMIGLTGLIAMTGGMIAEMSVSYISSKGERDLNEGKTREVDIKKEIHPTVLRRELENELMENGVSPETIRLIMDALGDDAAVLSSLVKTIRITQNHRSVLRGRGPAGFGAFLRRRPMGRKPPGPRDYRLCPRRRQHIGRRALHGGALRQADMGEYRAQPLHHHGDVRPHVSGGPGGPFSPSRLENVLSICGRLLYAGWKKR